MSTSTLHVETIHLPQFSKGSARDRAEFIRVLGESLKSTGFVKVAGHKVTQQDVNGAYPAGISMKG